MRLEGINCYGAQKIIIAINPQAWYVIFFYSCPPEQQYLPPDCSHCHTADRERSPESLSFANSPPVLKRNCLFSMGPAVHTINLQCRGPNVRFSTPMYLFELYRSISWPTAFTRSCQKRLYNPHAYPVSDDSPSPCRSRCHRAGADRNWQDSGFCLATPAESRIQRQGHTTDSGTFAYTRTCHAGKHIL